MMQGELFSQLSTLRKQGLIDDALRELRLALRCSELPPEAVERAGRLLPKLRTTCLGVSRWAMESA